MSKPANLDVDDVFSITSGMIDIFSSYPNGWDAMLLFFKLSKIRRAKGSKDAVFANREYLLAAMNSELPEGARKWGRDRLVAAKNVLKDHKCIEDVEVRKGDGTIGYRLLLNLSITAQSARVSTVSGKSVHGKKKRKNPVSSLPDEEKPGSTVSASTVYGKSWHGHNKEEDIFTWLLLFPDWEKNAGDPQEEKKEKIENLREVFEDPRDEDPGYLHSAEEFMSYLREAKFAEEFPYKVGDRESFVRTATECFIHQEEKGKRIRKQYAEFVFRKWLTPKWETEADRENLRKKYEAHQRAVRSKERKRPAYGVDDSPAKPSGDSEELKAAIKDFEFRNPEAVREIEAKAEGNVAARFPGIPPEKRSMLVKGERYKLLKEAFLRVGSAA